MFWRVRGRARMRSLARASRVRSGVLSAQRIVDEAATPPRLAFSVPRSVGTAVDRNRVRRQLRSACRECEHMFEPGASYLLSVHRTPSGGEAELAASLQTALDRFEALPAADASAHASVTR